MNKVETVKDTGNRLGVAKGEGINGLGKKGERIKKCKLIVTK